MRFGRVTNRKFHISQVQFVKLKKKHRLVASICLFCIVSREEQKGDISGRRFSLHAIWMAHFEGGDRQG